MQIFGTGVDLRLEGEQAGEERTGHAPTLTDLGTRGHPAAAEAGGGRVEAQCFVSVRAGNGRIDRWHGSTGYYGGPPVRTDPTSALLEVAMSERANNLGGILGDLRREGYDITRWEFWALPFRIDLSAGLRASLTGRWKERDPRAMPLDGLTMNAPPGRARK